VISFPIKAARYVSGILGLRQDDILLSSFPRSGSTWIRFVLCNLISLCEWQGKQVDFALLNETMVELGVSNLFKLWPYSTIPRVIKTHRAYWSVFQGVGGAIGVVRDPRDVMVSFFHFRKDLQRSYDGTFESFIRDRKSGLLAWFQHCNSWLPYWDKVVRYEDMKCDIYAEFKRILNAVGVDCHEEVVHEAIRRSRFRNVRSLEDSAGCSNLARFIRDGSTQQWRAYFSSADLAYYDGLTKEYGIDLYM
jgi:estrone sulfotransferase